MQRPRPPFPSHNGPLAASGRGAEPGWDAGPPSLQVRGSSGYEGRQWVTFVCREQPVFLRSKTKKQNKTVTHFSVIVLEAAPGARALRPETQPVKPWAGTKTRPRGPWHPEGSGRFGVQRTPLRARTGPRLGKAGPACVTTPPPTPTVSPGGECSQVGVCLPAGSCSQLGASWVCSPAGSEEGIDVFVQVLLSWAQECLQGAVSEPVP